MKRLVAIFLPIILALSVLAAAQEQQPLTNDSVLKMVQAGLGEDLIVTAVRTQPGKYSLGADELIRLKQAGVSEKILAAMLAKSGGASAPPSLPAAPVKILANTAIRLAVDEPVTSASAKPGDTFKLAAAEDLVLSGRVVIARGALATGRVVAVQHKKGMASADGMLEIAIDSIPAVNGQSVPLDAHFTIGGGNVSFGRKSREVQLDKGKVFTAHVATDTTVSD